MYCIYCVEAAGQGSTEQIGGKTIYKNADESQTMQGADATEMTQLNGQQAADTTVEV